MRSNTSFTDEVVMTGGTQTWSVEDFPLESDTLLDKAFRILYRIAYQGHLAVNFFLRPKTRGAYIAVWLDGKILLIRNSYKSVFTLPCGGIGRGESVVDAARRELLEEVGLDLPVAAFRQVFQKINHTEYKQDHISLFEVQLEVLPRLRPDGREVVWIGFRGSMEALDMPLFPPVRDYLNQQQPVVGDG
ncbi:MAG: NUDIX domain-containing protein [Gammaproteobacteria bacterium]|nr:NUDIX domain-containing protein [Gammaproteobacteria bacterium]